MKPTEKMNGLPVSAEATLGARFNLHSHLGTVKFIGPVEGTSGIWLGVEWDDPARGKHDGQGYFATR